MRPVRNLLLDEGILDRGRYRQLKSAAQRLGAINGAVRGLAIMAQHGDHKALVIFRRMRDGFLNAGYIDREKYEALKGQHRRVDGILEVFEYLFAACMAELDRGAMAGLRRLEEAA